MVYKCYLFTLLISALSHTRCLLQTNNTYFNDNDEVRPRVVNGVTARLGEIPYQVSLKKPVAPKSKTYFNFCGGVIISHKKILSAAHCFVKPDRKRKNKNSYVVAGSLMVKSEKFEDGQWRKIATYKYPRNYKFPYHDIVLVFLTSPLHFNNYVRSIPISSKYIDYRGKCLASGYGRIENTEKVRRKKNKRKEHLDQKEKIYRRNAQTNQTQEKNKKKKYLNKFGDHLLMANLSLVPTAECTKRHRRSMRRFVCTSTTLTNVAKGDSGGPLVCRHTEEPNEDPQFGILVGIVCGIRPRASAYFTRVSSYRDFLKPNNCDKISNNLAIIFGFIFYCLFYSSRY